MKRRPRKSKFKVPQKHSNTTNKPVMPFRNPDTVSEREWKKIDKLEDEYFSIMRRFYNCLVPSKYQVPQGAHILRMTRTLGTTEVFGIEASAEHALLSLLGTSSQINSQLLNELILSSIDGKKVREKTAKQFKKELSIEQIKNIPGFSFKKLKKVFLVLVEENPSDYFLENDSWKIDFNDKNVKKWLEPVTQDERLFFQMFKDGVARVKIINQVNNPQAYRYYLELKDIMNRIDQHGVIGL